MRGYDLLRSVLEETKKVALAKVQAPNAHAPRAPAAARAALLARHDALRRGARRRATSLRRPSRRSRATREKQLALHLVDELSGPFDPAKHPDEYRSAVLAAVDEKVEAGEVARDTTAEGEAAATTPATGAQVIDLAELLSRSIKAAGKPGPAKAKESPHAERSEKEEKGKAGTGGGRRKRATG